MRLGKDTAHHIECREKCTLEGRRKTYKTEVFYIFAPGTGCLASFPLEQHFLLIWHYSGGFFFQCFCLCGKLWYSGNFQSWAFNISPSATKKSYFRLWFKLCGNKLFLNVQQRLLPLYRFQKAARRHISAWNPWDHRVLHLSTGWDEKWECYSSTQTASSWILSTYTHTRQPTSYYSHAMQPWLNGHFINIKQLHLKNSYNPSLIFLDKIATNCHKCTFFHWF